MPTISRLPWLALFILLFCYSTLGWALSDTKAPLFVWLGLVLSLFIVVGTLTAPYPTISSYTNFLFRSSFRSFCVSVVGAFLFFVMIAWFRVFLDMLMIVSAAILARIDFQVAGYKEGKAFVTMLMISVAGIGLGVLINMLVKHQIPVLHLPI